MKKTPAKKASAKKVISKLKISKENNCGCIDSHSFSGKTINELMEIASAEGFGATGQAMCYVDLGVEGIKKSKNPEIKELVKASKGFNFVYFEL